MAVRKWYGRAAADVVAQVTVDDGDYGPASRTFDVYTAETSGDHHTSLLNGVGSGISAVAAGADGTIPWQGNDGYTGGYWLQDQAHPGNPRVGPFWPHDAPDRLVAVEAALAAGGGAYVLPVDGIPLTDLDEDTQDLVNGAVQDDGLGTSLLKADGSALAIGAAGQVVRSDGAGTALEFHTPEAASFRDSDDVDFGTPTDGAIPRYDLSDDVTRMTDAGAVFAPVDANGDLDPAAYPPGFVKTWVINSGGSLPAGSSAGDLVWVRSVAAAALDVSSVGTANNGTSASATQTVTNSGATFSSGDYAVLCVSVSAETTFPTSITVAGPTNIGAMTQVAGQAQGTTVATYVFVQKATGTVATSQTFTITSTGGTASRNDWAVRLLKVTGLASSAVVDLATNTGGSNATNLSVSTGASATTQASEVAIAAFGYNPVTGGTFTPGGGWTQIGTPVANTDSGPKAVAVVYKILTATAAQTASAAMTNPVVYAAALATLKGA